MFHISDFILPKKLIEAACQSKGVGFVDLAICFEDPKEFALINNKLYIGEQTSIEATYWEIIKGYLNNFKTIHGQGLFASSKEATVVYQQIQSFLDKLFKETKKADGWRPEKPVVQRLYQYPLVWVLMKDFICPIEETEITNLKIVYFNSPCIDMAKHFNSETNEELELDKIEADWIFLNSDCLYEPIEQACLFLSAVEGHGICPKELMLKIKDNLFLYEKLKGVANLYFMDEEDAANFINFVLTFSGVENLSETLASSDNISKEAQMIEPNHSNWWFFGLIEKMLEPARGSDQRVHESLESLRDLIQKRVLKVREESGLEGANYEKLLRALDDDSESRYVILEKELSSDRLW